MLQLALARTRDVPGAGGDSAPRWMGDSERLRWASLQGAARCDFVASRDLLRGLLRTRADVTWDVSAEPCTAPVARSASGDVPASLSHRLGWVAAAIADTRVGVDVEVDRPARGDPAERAALMLGATELVDWHALPGDQRESALLTRWTAKEAWFKASPPGAAPWDFRRVVARACPAAQANVRVWTAPPLYVAVCCSDPRELAGAHCEGLAPAAATSSYWHVAAASATA